ncbi:MIT domain-containing protein 1 [Toxocara canis]|uniref:MIT domain-containing protein 1 n=1 Tax=Toxocara canis TaxID=6265 RepID=A0A0B2VYN9_TOXCA|nr:MIT domain-containing protein 1 [Toxocara canis]
MRASRPCRRFKRALFSDVFLPQNEPAGLFLTKSETKLEITEQKVAPESKDVAYWTEFLASQLDCLRTSSECLESEKNDKGSLKSTSGECCETLTDLNAEIANCCPSVSSPISSCSASDSSVRSLSDRSPAKQKPARRAPGSLNIEELLSEGSAKKSKGYNVKFVKEIHIEDGSMGYGYDKLFGDALDARLRSVFVNDPYIRLKSQAANFVVFCEVLMANAPNLEQIILRTQNDSTVDHRMLFSHLRWALFQNGIRLDIQRSGTIHDREIRLNFFFRRFGISKRLFRVSAQRNRI